jgi:transposase-like protein
MIALTKHCTKCDQTKAVEEFHKHGYTRDGLQHWCKPCTTVYHRQHREKIARERMVSRGTVPV